MNSDHEICQGTLWGHAQAIQAISDEKQAALDRALQMLDAAQAEIVQLRTQLAALQPQTERRLTVGEAVLRHKPWSLGDR